MKSSNVHFTFFRMGKILEGLLAGAVEAEVPHGVECLRDAKHIWERIGGVVDQFKVASFNSVLHAVEDLGNVIHDVSQQLEQCKATVGTDLDKLRAMAKAFQDPWYFIFHIEHDLIVNGQDVHHEMMDAMAQWDNQHYYEFGHSIGLALSKIFVGGQMANGIPAHALPHHTEALVHHEPVVHEPVAHHNWEGYHYGDYHHTATDAHDMYPSHHTYHTDAHYPTAVHHEAWEPSHHAEEHLATHEPLRHHDYEHATEAYHYNPHHEYTTYAHHEATPYHDTYHGEHLYGHYADDVILGHQGEHPVYTTEHHFAQ
jgi:hypothetical protein